MSGGRGGDADIAAMLRQRNEIMFGQGRSVFSDAGSKMSGSVSNYIDNVKSCDTKTIIGTCVGFGLVLTVGYAIYNDLIQKPNMDDLQERLKMPSARAKAFAKEAQEYAVRKTKEVKKWANDSLNPPRTPDISASFEMVQEAVPIE